MNLRVVSIAVAVALGMLGAVLLANPADLGISPVSARWLSILAVGLGILQGFLPRVQGPTRDPEALADRVMSLSTEDRAQLVAEVERRRMTERLFDEGPRPTPAPRPDPRLSNPRAKG